MYFFHNVHMKVAGRVTEKRLRKLVSVDEMQFGFMLER